MAGKAGSSCKNENLSNVRTPLGDGSATANMVKQSTVTRPKSPVKLGTAVLKNESLVGNGSLTVPHTISSLKNQRSSHVSSEATSENKRNSAISATSTNASGTARKRKTHIGPWQLGSTVGKGGTARVRKVRHAVTGQTGVAKIVPIAVAERARALSLANLVESAQKGDPTLYFDKAIPLGLEREIAIMKCLRHPNIVRLFDVWENRNEIYLIMEYVPGGELFDYVARNQRLGEDVTVYLFRQIIWALKYCHGLNIHHRDLKPENILLDYETMTVKLVDFGMAALQPEGNLLSTPCGSPHYAAPELLLNQPYNGGQADVWSAGVVLFVMLYGLPPFNFPADARSAVPESDKLKSLFQAIARADYKMPRSFSKEAQDLIRRIFVVNPKNRITIDEIWEHQLIHKFDALWGQHKLDSSDSLTELTQAAKVWRPLKRKRVDPQIFRALRTLWHSESDTALLDKLCSKDFNQAKFFYQSMLRYREENFGNLQLSQNGFGYSASDYQHSKPALVSPSLSNNSPSGSTKTKGRVKSQYSITGDEHLSSKHSYYDLPGSEASYDPFRASRSPIINRKSDYLNVTLHGRHSSMVCNSRGNSLRINVLRGHSRHSSRRSSRCSSASTSLRRQRTSGKQSSKSSSSRVSMRSSLFYSGSPLPVMRPSEVHKRGVQFSHPRKESTGAAVVADAETVGGIPDYGDKTLQRINLPMSKPGYFASSPPPQSMDAVRVPKKRLPVPTPRTRKLKDQAEIDARKVSVELGKVCDEAFWRLSGDSSPQSSSDKPLSFVDTPPSSIRPSPYGNPKQGLSVSDSVRNRPLPPTPMGTRSTLQPSETPSTFTARELTEMRERLAVRYAKEGTRTQGYFNDVLRQLDQLMMQSEGRRHSLDGRRIASAPPDCPYMTDSMELMGLHVIPEEGRGVDVDGNELRCEELEVQFIAEEAGRHRQLKEQLVDNTIRVVDPSPYNSLSGAPWAPLNIRKANSKSSKSSESTNSADPTMDQHQETPCRGYRHSHRYGGFYGHVTAPFQNDEDEITIAPLQPAFEQLEENSPPTLSARNSAHIRLASSKRPDSVANPYFDTYPLGQGYLMDNSPPPKLLGHLSTISETSKVQESHLVNLTSISKISELDSRKTTRDAREAAANKNAQSRFSPAAFTDTGLLHGFRRKLHFFKGKIGQDPEHERTATIEPTEDPTKGMTAHLVHDGQKDLDYKYDVSTKGKFNGGKIDFLREYLYNRFMKPAVFVIALNVDRDVAWTRALEHIDHSPYYVVHFDDIDTGKYTLEVLSPKKAIPAVKRDFTFVAEFFPLSKDGSPIKACLLRLVQVSGPASAIYHVANQIKVDLRSREVLVRDEEESDAMKAALYQGLAPKLSGWV